MKKVIFVFLFLASLVITTPVSAYVSVKGYYRSNGTYVAPHVRSNPNGLKYDNYSYTPSQGLYNKTYGTKGTYWDTPTYTTDPNYYLGKSIYDSGNSYTSNYSAPTIPSCPSNSYYDGVSSCKCSYGYISSNGSCVSGNSLCWTQTGYSSSYDSTTSSCKCDYGYVIGSSGKCEYKTTTSSETSNYPTNNCPLNSHQSSSDTTKCECDYGYQVNQTKTLCVLTTNYTNVYPNQTAQDDKTIGINYYKTNKTCSGLKNNDNQYAECISYAYNH